MLRCSLLGVFAASLIVWIVKPVVAEEFVIRQAPASESPAQVFVVTERRGDEHKCEECKRHEDHGHHEHHDHGDHHWHHGQHCEHCDAHCGHGSGCCHDATLHVRTSNARVCFTQQGLYSFAALFTNATQKAMENVAVRALNATQVSPPCKDDGEDDDDDDDDD